MAVQRGPSRDGRSRAEDVDVQVAERDDETADWRKLHVEELRDLYC